jgi:toxin ParE1/3/4
VTPKPVVPREQANQDVDEAVSHYLADATPETALGFIDALEAAYAHIGRHPSAGSPRYAHALDLPDLRVWPLGHFPYLIFYVEHAGHIDVWRILHGARDIPAWLREPDGA